MTKVVKFPTAPVGTKPRLRDELGFRKPMTFTSAETLIFRIADEIITSHRTYHEIAADAGVTTTTIARIARRETKWPRHTTIFPLLIALDLELEVRNAR